MTISRGWRLLGAMCAVGLVLAGCGDRGPGGGDDERSPLERFFGWDESLDIGGDREWSEEERQQHYDHQELVAECMRDAGFEYYEEPFWGDQDDPWRMVDDPWQEAWELEQSDPEAYARTYGYGIATIRYDNMPEPVEDWDPSDDPNWEYRESLSQAAQQAYEEALWGYWEEPEEPLEPGEEGEIVEEWDPTREGAGCYDRAWAEVYDWTGGEGEDDWRQWEPLWEEWDKLYQRIEEDDRLVAVALQWSDCMATAGYSGLDSLDDGRNEVHRRQADLEGWDWDDDGFGGRGAGLSAVQTDGPDDEWDGDEPWEPVEIDPEDLAELQEFELAIAWADYECRQEHEVDQVRQDVQFEHEEQFIEDHRELLEAFRDFENERRA